MATIPEKYRVNRTLVMRFETASAYPPISTGTLDQYNRIADAINDSKTWEDVPEDIRSLIEQSESNGNIDPLT